MLFSLNAIAEILILLFSFNSIKKMHYDVYTIHFFLVQKQNQLLLYLFSFQCFFFYSLKYDEMNIY